VVGSTSLMYEAELVQIYDRVFTDLGLEVEILVNNRKVLYGFAEALSLEDKFMDMTICLDKLEKIGPEKVIEELVKKGIEEEKGQKLISFIKAETLSQLEEQFANAPTGLKGLDELREFHQYLDSTETKNTIKFDPSLARGLNYYTGCIFEVKAKGVDMGSIGGGGRYDDLTAVFGLKDMSGVGVSFGFARIHVVMSELKLFPENLEGTTQLMIASFDEDSHKAAFVLGSELRRAGIKTDIYPAPVKMKKQLNYANKKGIPYVVFIGENERKAQIWQLKEMSTGNQFNLDTKALIQHLQEKR